MHCFQDEFGNWHSYTFGPESSGTATSVSVGASTGPASANTVNGRLLASLLRQQSSQDSSASGGGGGGGGGGHHQQAAAGAAAPSSSSHRSRSNSVSNSSGLTVILDSPTAGGADDGDRSPAALRRRGPPDTHGPGPGGYLAYSGMPAVIRSHRSPLNLFAETLFSDRRRHQAFGQQAQSGAGAGAGEGNQGEMAMTEAASAAAGGLQRVFSEQIQKVKKYYNFRLFPWPRWLPSWKVTFDRLALLTALDRNICFAESALAVVLAVAVGVACAMVLEQDYYQVVWGEKIASRSE